jgi:uncharacterized OsmC-like protein
MGVTMQGRSLSPTAVELLHPSGTVFRTAAPLDNGGDGSSFSPTDLCTVSLGACGTTIMSMFAANHGIPLAGIGFTITKEMVGPPRKIGRIILSYRLAGSLTEDEFRRVVAAGKACPVRLTLGDAVEIVEEYLRA